MAKFYIAVMMGLLIFSSAARAGSGGLNIFLLVSKAQEWRDMDEQRRFLTKYKAPDLEFYIDDKGALTEAFGIFSSPHTVLINKSGQEIGRIRGSVEWDDDDVIEYMYKLKVQHG